MSHTRAAQTVCLHFPTGTGPRGGEDGSGRGASNGEFPWASLSEEQPQKGRAQGEGAMKGRRNKQQTHGRERGRRRNGIQNSKEKMETREGNKVETEETHNTLPFETVQAGGWQGMGTRHRQKTGGSQSALSPATAGQGAGGGGGCTVRTVSGPVCERTLGNKATPEGHRREGQNRREGDGFLRVQGSVLSNLTEPRSHGPGPRVTDDLPSRAAVP